MLRLAEKIRKKQEGEAINESDFASSPSLINASVRDKLLAQEIPEIKINLPSTCKMTYPDPNKIHEFKLEITPNEGIWQHGRFIFDFNIPETYNHAPPVVKCLTKIWHPNIDEHGNVCLSILRQASLDLTGWTPTRKLMDVIWGLESLFGDLCDFTDALNVKAAEQYLQNKDAFIRTARNFMLRYAFSAHCVRALSTGAKTTPPPGSTKPAVSSKAVPAKAPTQPQQPSAQTLQPMNVDHFEERVAELERLILGVRNLAPQRPPKQTISDMIADAQKQVTLAEKQPKIKEILNRMSELSKYMDPNYLDDQAVATTAKINAILSHEAEIRQTAQALEAFQSLKDVLNNPAYSDLSAMRAKFAEMHQKHAEQEIQANDFIDESIELLEAYANAVSLHLLSFSLFHSF
ncbi:unnamed protein product [Rodentolepis nana]|uniref:E2 NEDD8-conjugating enzyme n=1 Tax=Rodentolepis nana TaxID=102285 RepID=A0A0R3T576_RODNA|nr:unnamed protein product [Rodentolepis nana]